MASTLTALEREERLKSALWYALGQYIDEISLQKDLQATPQFIGALTELVWQQISNSAKDLERFAKHAGRSVIREDDVLLLARRNEELEEILRKKLEEIRADEGRDKDGGGERRVSRGGATAGRGRGRGRGKGK